MSEYTRPYDSPLQLCMVIISVLHASTQWHWDSKGIEVPMLISSIREKEPGYEANIEQL